MFQHLYQGSSDWILPLLELGLILHIGSGGVAIFSGAGALVFRKGGRLHRQLGTVFLAAMLVMAGVASLLAAVAVAMGHQSQISNIFAGAFAFYLVTTGWLSVRRDEGVVGRFEIGGCIGVALIAAVALFWLLPITLSPEGRAHGVPPAAPIILAAVAALLAALDLKVIFRGGVAGRARIVRHLWRMCLGLFIATGSFFIGQQQDMPVSVRGSPILLLLGVAPLIAMIFWIARMWIGAAASARRRARVQHASAGELRWPLA